MGELVKLETRKQYELSAVTGNEYEQFIKYLDASKKTIETYSKAVKQFALYCAERKISQPQREDVIAYREQLKETHKPSTVQNYIVAVRLFFRWLDQAGLYPNVADHVKGAKLDRSHKKDYLTSEQAKSVLAGIERETAKGKRDYAILSLMLTCGLRDIEIARADIQDLGTVADSTVLYVQGKGKQERTEYVKVPAPAEKAIRDYLKTRKSTKGSLPLFVSTSNNNTDGRLTTRAISGAVKTALKNAGYDSERLTAHSLRHTAVTLSLLAGKDITEVQQFARHSNISTTMIYNHALDKAKNSCSEAVANSLFA